MEGITTFGIFRCAKEGSSLNGKYQKTMRPPGNVPYVVDNLWEWKRPEGCADRRRSAYASPRVDLAQKSGPKGGIVYRVEFEGDVKLCQLVGYPDSKYHPDCRNLRSLLFGRLGQDWVDADLSLKSEIGKLWIPCLTKFEVEWLFNTVGRLKEIREEVFQAISYWDSVAVLKEGDTFPDDEGELFFEPMAGYRLIPLIWNAAH